MNANLALGQGMTLSGLVLSMTSPDEFLLLPDGDQGFSDPVRVAVADETLILVNGEEGSPDAIKPRVRATVTGWAEGADSVLKPVTIEITRPRILAAPVPVTERRVSPPLTRVALLCTFVGASLLAFYAWRAPPATTQTNSTDPGESASQPWAKVERRTTGPYRGGSSPVEASSAPLAVALPAQLHDDISLAFEVGLKSSLVRLDEPEDIALFRRWLLRARVLGRKIPGAFFVESRGDDGMEFRYRLTYSGKTEGYLTWRLIGERWCLVDVEPATLR